MLPIVLVGAFNIDILRNTPQSDQLLNLMESYYHGNVIYSPTGKTGLSETLIYLCVTNCEKSDVMSDIFVSDLSDHPPIFCIFFPKKAEYAKLVLLLFLIVGLMKHLSMPFAQ